MKNANSVVSVKVIGFFTVLLLFTLNGDSGRDLCDVTVEYIEAQTRAIYATLDNS